MSPRRFLLTLLPAAALSGCVATQRDVLDLSAQMDDMKLKMAQLQATMENLQKNQADLFAHMDQMQTSMTSLNENLGDFNNQLSTLKSRWDDLESKVDSRMRSVQETVQKQQAEEAAQVPSRTFRDAELNLYRQNWDLALQGFALYLKLAPQGELADAALYNTGEAQLGKRDYAAAAKSYATVLDKYPHSRLTAAARLRYALALLSMPEKGTEEAERYLQSVVEDFPHTAEAAAAAERLKALAEAREDARKAEQKGRERKKKPKSKKAPRPEAPEEEAR